MVAVAIALPIVSLMVHSTRGLCLKTLAHSSSPVINNIRLPESNKDGPLGRMRPHVFMGLGDKPFKKGVEQKGSSKQAGSKQTGSKQNGSKQPAPNTKQPLGKKQVGSETLEWLSVATKPLAASYMALYDKAEQVRNADDTAEDALVAAQLRGAFGVAPLVSQVYALLESDDSLPDRETADKVRSHVPTVWASFSGEVRALLQQRAPQAADASTSWSEMPAWLTLRQFYADARDDDDFRWSLSRKQRAAALLSNGTGTELGEEGVTNGSPATAHVDGAEEVEGRVLSYAEHAEQLLLLEREAALATALRSMLRNEEHGVGGEAESDAAEDGERSARMRASSEKPAGASLSGLRLRNAQALDGRILLTLTSANRSASILNQEAFSEEDIVLIRLDEPKAAARSILASEASETTTLRQVARRRHQLGLRGVVSRRSTHSLGVNLELVSDDDDAGGACVIGDSSERSACSAVELPATFALIKPLVGEQVRVDYLANDVTHRRNVFALAELRRIAREACNGRQLPAFPILRAAYVPTEGGGQAEGGQPSDEVLPRRAGVRGEGQFPAYNPLLVSSQLAAVDAALRDGPPLAVLQGPPGSGKTSVVVELVQQAIAARQRVLLCAPSNMAVDLLARRLGQADPQLRLVRVGNPARMDAASLALTPQNVAMGMEEGMRRESEALLEEQLAELAADPRMKRERRVQMRGFLQRRSKRALARALADGEGLAVAQAQVVLSTTTMAADPSVMGAPLFDLAVLDEAGQATEPNSWLPVLRARRAVFVGDPMQLSPTVLSGAASGLQRSLMERAMATNPSRVWLLTVQWRMHRLICAWASEQLYGSRLTSHSSAADRLLCHLDGVRRTAATESPLVALDTRPAAGGYEQRDSDGAICNSAEAEVVLAHVSGLLRTGVDPSQMAVISPYSAQVDLLNAVFRRAALEEGGTALQLVKASTIDSYQGREAEAVVVSLVRSNRRGSIGFLADERRLNVAVTRARRHVALVFDSGTLKQQPFLRSLLEYCAVHGRWLSVSSQDGLNELHAPAERILQREVV